MMDDHLANPFRVDSTFKVIMEESIFPRELFLEIGKYKEAEN